LFGNLKKISAATDASTSSTTYFTRTSNLFLSKRMKLFMALYLYSFILCFSLPYSSLPLPSSFFRKHFLEILYARK
ncbi:hypothetical protein ACJX0J_012914, partial [Zea mays]